MALACLPAMFQNKEYEKKMPFIQYKFQVCSYFFTEPQQDRKLILSKTAVA